MDFLNFILPVLLYIFGIILLIVLIILGIRMIQMLDRVDRLVDDIEHKMGSLNTLFTIIDRTTDGFALITDHFVSSVTSVISKIFKRKNKEEIIDE